MDLITSLGALAFSSRLRRLSDLIMKDGQEIYKKHNLEFNPRWFPLYCLLKDESAVSVSEAATRLLVSHPTVIQISRDMIRHGLMESTPDPNDKRGRLLSLTKRGRSMLPKLEPVWQDIEAAARELILSGGRDLLADLEAIERALDERTFVDRVLGQSRQRQQEEVEIVEFRPEYRDYFRTLNEEWLTKYFRIEEVDREILENPERVVLEHGGYIVFARLGGEIIGTCAMKQTEEGVYELTKMGVTPKAQGKQAGYKLGAACIEWARKQKAKKVFLETNSILTPALNLYRKLGFVMATRPEMPSKYDRSEIYMELESPREKGMRAAG